MTDEQKKRFAGLVCVEVTGESCASCLTLAPVLKEVIAKRDDIRLDEVEVKEENRDLIEEWGVDRIPTTLLLDDGVPFARCHGFQPDEILEIWIDTKLEEYKLGKK